MGNSTSVNEVHHLALHILEYLTFSERGLVFSLNKNYYEFSQTDVVYRWLCYRLTIERKVYSPLKLSPGMTWRKTFLELYKIRNLWVGDAHTTIVGQGENFQSLLKENFKINVYARFRPLNEGIQFEHKQITLPLHQRLGLIKISCNLKSNREALRILKEEGSWFGKKWEEHHQKLKDIDNKSEEKKQISHFGNNNNNKQKQSTPLHAHIQHIDVGSGRVIVMTPDVGIREFSYDGVFPSTCEQKTVYDIAGLRLVADVINGFNATLIMYGQTGSGKTYTMFGLDIFTPEDNTKNDIHINKTFIRQSHGLVYRACDAIIQAISARRSLGIEAELYVSYVEIYGDTITDLLKNGQRCGHSKTAAHQFVLSGAAELQVNVMDDIIHLLKIGEEQKRRAATAMNDRSTRAHGIFILHLKQHDLNSDVSISSKLFLADLGGSEQVKKSQVEPGQSKKYHQNRMNSSEFNTPDSIIDQTSSTEESSAITFSTGFELGERMRETVYINLGLLALKKCVEALNNHQPYVPYQDSKLTMLLSAGLANGKTSIIICNNSDTNHIIETISTLRFGEKCSQIELEIRNNATVLESMLLSIDEEIKELERQIVLKERWETIEEKRQDILAEEGTVESGQGGIEKRYITILTGAESERNRLDDLIRQRAELTGSDYVQQAYQTKVIGFGKTTKYGKKYNPNEEEVLENERFLEKVSAENVPVVVRTKGKKWKMGKDLEVAPEVLEKKALTVKRNKLVYSGLS